MDGNDNGQEPNEDIVQHFVEENRMIIDSQWQLQFLRQVAALNQQQQNEQTQDEEVRTPSTIDQACIHEDIQSTRHNLVDIMPMFPVLWNTSLRCYKDLNKKDAAWREISTKLNVPSKLYHTILSK